MAAFFDAGSNAWVNSPTGNYVYKPAPNPPPAYPVFDPSINCWITSGNYGAGSSISGTNNFHFLSNAWIQS